MAPPTAANAPADDPRLPAALATAGLSNEEIELRTFGGGQYYGRFMLTPKPGSRPSLQARLVAVTLADHAGRALAAGTPAPSTR